ncbi:ExbD/TolR family protein [Congregibacter litoralis]|uniref:Outer membrane transport energization protein ExbD n=1 Tax=Congregibacter litoralis KT71 TaxID=314285 RepID=A4ABY8_9GAMM|nr:biopolymer transporter ExbD [Congregibacter litoralis]EAQ96438.1 outer membrane transport energization protein ExbD [Congregibacter litoralis KT71]
MRKLVKKQEDEGAEIDLTPMLDVVFIMLIFFIVVASFIKEAGIEINRPDNTNSDPSDATSILVRIQSDDQIWMENRRVDARAVRANIQRLLAADPEQAVSIKVDKGAKANTVVEVADSAREAGAGAINWASGERK